MLIEWVAAIFQRAVSQFFFRHFLSAKFHTHVTKILHKLKHNIQLCPCMHACWGDWTELRIFRHSSADL